MSDVEELSDEQAVIEANAKLIKDDDSPITCHEHGITRRWGDLSPIAQLAVLSGLDVAGDRCIIDERKQGK